jgi:uncharacterized protein (DUF697 family)/GTPase SAR1 family protein
MKKHPKILVCGKHSSGKTSLIKAVCPEGTVPDEAINENKKEGFEYVIYETEFVDFVDVGRVDLDCLVAAYRDDLKDEAKDHLHCDCVWYCIDGSEKEVSPGELEVLKLFGDKALAVITKSGLLENKVQDKLLEELEKIIPKERIVIVSSKSKIGLSKLLECSRHMIYRELEEDDEELFKTFNEWNKYFGDQQETWSVSVTDLTDEYVNWGAGRAFAIAFVPIPLADVVPLVANEAYMIYKIGACYGYAVDQTILASFLGCLGGSIAGKLMASFIPFLKAPIAAAVTYGVGRAAVAYFESGMKLGEEELKEIFRLAKQKGKEINWKASV